MLKITIDTNCLIDVAETRPAAAYVLELYRHHLAKNIELAITGITASENQLRGGQITNFDEFRNRVVKLGFSDIQILKPVRYVGVTFWGWEYWASNTDAELERKIHHILFPNVPYLYSEFCEKFGLPSDSPIDLKWRNRKCDVLSIHSHIVSKRNVFVSSDQNFHKITKKPELIALGAGEILMLNEIGRLGL